MTGDERAQGAVISTLFASLILAFLLGLAVFVAHVQPVEVAVHAAARNCTRMSIETLSAGRGPDQGYAAAYQTLAGHNFDVEHAQVVIQHDGWDRGGVVTCRVRYGVDVSWMPFVGLFFDGGTIPLEGVAASRIEPYKSRWED